MSKTYRPIDAKHIDSGYIIHKRGSTSRLSVHQRLTYLDSRNDNQPPSYYRDVGDTLHEFKNIGALGISDTTDNFCALDSKAQWRDISGGPVTQVAYTQNGIWWRSSKMDDDTGWNKWYKLQHKSMPYQVGTYPLLHVPYSTTSSGDHVVGTVYNLKDQLLNIFPTRTGFTRTYKIIVDANSSTNSVDIYLGGYHVQNVCVWGANQAQTARVWSTDATSIINALATGHCQITIRNTDNGSGTFFYLNQMYILIYDEPN